MLNRNKELEDKVKNIVEAQGAETLELKIFSSRGNNIVRCLVDLPCGGITMGDCTEINRKVVSYLEDSKALGDDFSVEINSPGLDRPLKNYRDFLKVKGKTVSLWLSEPICDKEYLEGKIEEVNESKISLLYKDEILEINIDKIKTGKEKIEIK